MGKVTFLKLIVTIINIFFRNWTKAFLQKPHSSRSSSQKQLYTTKIFKKHKKIVTKMDVWLLPEKIIVRKLPQTQHSVPSILANLPLAKDHVPSPWGRALHLYYSLVSSLGCPFYLFQLLMCRRSKSPSFKVFRLKVSIAADKDSVFIQKSVTWSKVCIVIKISIWILFMSLIKNLKTDFKVYIMI